MLYATNPEELNTRYETAMFDQLLQGHPKVLTYVNKMYDRRELWAICHREKLLIRGNNTNNFCETAMRVLKDQILNRTKAFNVQQLLDFICSKMEHYYERRCIDVANNVLCRVQQSRYLLQDTCSLDQVTKVTEMEFHVRSCTDPSTSYEVNMSLGLCTCRTGCTGGPCKHQAAVVQKFGLPSWNFIPEADPQMRQLLCYIGSGQCHKLNWFQPLITDSVHSASAQMTEVHVPSTSQEHFQIAINDNVSEGEHSSEGKEAHVPGTRQQT
eukprot:TRINITY_DN58127_c0_g1_i1.p1 TRINITY_DN58127_c0_g1~~TRINITY_DN58127_c0_g1_i1.p1  ORF type:complete len:269 (-),score=45.25 TRINITY_DN58127_c0_g1_i1:4-810(-)